MTGVAGGVILGVLFGWCLAGCPLPHHRTPEPPPDGPDRQHAECGCVFRLVGARLCTFVHEVWCGRCALLAFRATGEWPVTS